MKSLFKNQAGIRALAKNIAYTSTSGGDYWKSGLEVVPNTTNTSAIAVDVESGTVSLNGSDVSIGSQSVTLDAASTNPRIDVIQATTNGMSVVKGVEQKKRPNSTDDGTEGTFPNIWQPAPDDGGGVNGVARAIVIVRPSVSDSTDITASDIRNYNADGVEAVTQDNLRSSVEGLSDPVGIQATDAQELDGEVPGRYQRNEHTLAAPPGPAPLASGEQRASILSIPPNHRIQIQRTSLITSGNTKPSGLECAVQLLRSGTTFEPFRSANANEWSQNGAGEVANIQAQSVRQRLRFLVENTGSSTISGAQGQIVLTIEDLDRD